MDRFGPVLCTLNRTSSDNLAHRSIEPCQRALKGVAASTREEVILLFGTNQSWKGAQDEVGVSLSNRVILNPYAAKRLAILLGGVVSAYEQRFGAPGVDPSKQ